MVIRNTRQINHGRGRVFLWVMSKASLINWSVATWVDTYREGDSELCGHLRKSVSGQGSSQCKGPVAATCLVCVRTTRKAVKLECRAWASKSSRHKVQRDSKGQSTALWMTRGSMGEFWHRCAMAILLWDGTQAMQLPAGSVLEFPPCNRHH